MKSMPVKEIDRAACNGCGICLESCPADIIRLDYEGKAYITYPDDCYTCYLCEIDCPTQAIKVSAEIGSMILPY